MAGGEDTRSSAPLWGGVGGHLSVPTELSLAPLFLCSFLPSPEPWPMGQAGAEPTVLKAATGVGSAPKDAYGLLRPRAQVRTRGLESLHDGAGKERPRSTKCLQAASELSLEDQPLLCGRMSGEQPSGMGTDGMDKHTVPVGTDLAAVEVRCCRAVCVNCREAERERQTGQGVVSYRANGFIL